jgi:hypothetical protein
MATRKTRKARKPPGGPFLAAAVFCDSVVRDDGGAMTAVRIIDHVTITIPTDAPPDVPSEENRLIAQVEGLVAFKKGSAGRRHKVKLVMHSPSGKSQVMNEQEADFKDEEHGGFSLRLKTMIAISEGGLFWMDVRLDGKLMTRMPLRITVNRAEVGVKPAGDPTLAAVVHPRKKKG